MEDASGAGRSTGDHSGLEAAAAEAERVFLAALEMWFAERGAVMPPRKWMEGLPDDAPESVREAERRYLEARDAWWDVRDQWLVNWGREPRPDA
jgi:hypothetical protein